MTSSNPIIPVILNRPTPHTQNIFQPHALVLTPQKQCLFNAIASSRKTVSAFKKYKERKERKEKKEAEPTQLSIEQEIQHQRVHFKLKTRQVAGQSFNKNTYLQTLCSAFPHFYDPNEAPLYESGQFEAPSASSLPLKVQGSMELIEQLKQPLVQQKMNVQHSEDVWETQCRVIPSQPSDTFIIIRREKVKKIKEKNEFKTKMIKKQKIFKKDADKRSVDGLSWKDFSGVKSIQESSDNEGSLEKDEHMMDEIQQNLGLKRKIFTLNELMRQAKQKVAGNCQQKSPRQTLSPIIAVDHA